MMRPYCDYQNWLQRLLHRQCWRIARHIHFDTDDNFGINACDNHEYWYRVQIDKHYKEKI